MNNKQWIERWAFDVFKNDMHINELFFKPNDQSTKDLVGFAEQFNKCSEHFRRMKDESLSESERNEAFENWKHERYKLETGSY